MQTLRTILFMSYFCLVMILLGGTIFSVVVEYPNWFSNIPASLEVTRNFYKVLHPGYFFQTVGPLTLLSGIAFVIVGWRVTEARNYTLLALAALVTAELLTFIYIYPRLGIIFAPDVMSTSIDVVRQASEEFTFADQIRTGLGVLGAGLSVAALLRYLRHALQVPADGGAVSIRGARIISSSSPPDSICI